MHMRRMGSSRKVRPLLQISTRQDLSGLIHSLSLQGGPTFTC